jgi:hypothetical protein
VTAIIAVGIAWGLTEQRATRTSGPKSRAPRIGATGISKVISIGWAITAILGANSRESTESISKLKSRDIIRVGIICRNKPAEGTSSSALWSESGDQPTLRLPACR